MFGNWEAFDSNSSGFLTHVNFTRNQLFTIDNRTIHALVLQPKTTINDHSISNYLKTKQYAAVSFFECVLSSCSNEFSFPITNKWPYHMHYAFYDMNTQYFRYDFVCLSVCLLIICLLHSVCRASHLLVLYWLAHSKLSLMNYSFGLEHVQQANENDLNRAIRCGSLSFHSSLFSIWIGCIERKNNNSTNI